MNEFALVFGGAVTGGSLIWAVRSWFFRRRSAVATGKVIKVDFDYYRHTRDSIGNRYYYPTVHFEDHSGVQRVFISRDKTTIRYQTGDVVTVFYDRSNPAHVRVYNPGLWIAQLFGVLLGLGIVIYGFIGL